MQTRDVVCKRPTECLNTGTTRVEIIGTRFPNSRECLFRIPKLCVKPRSEGCLIGNCFRLRYRTAPRQYPLAFRIFGVQLRWPSCQNTHHCTLLAKKNVQQAVLLSSCGMDYKAQRVVGKGMVVVMHYQKMRETIPPPRPPGMSPRDGRIVKMVVGKPSANVTW